MIWDSSPTESRATLQRGPSLSIARKSTLIWRIYRHHHVFTVSVTGSKLLTPLSRQQEHFRAAPDQSDTRINTILWRLDPTTGSVQISFSCHTRRLGNHLRKTAQSCAFLEATANARPTLAERLLQPCSTKLPASVLPSDPA